MIYIVCFIHVVYWLHIGSEPFISLILFEMPVIFFIAGAAQSLGKKKKTLGAIVWSRLKRVVFPFYVYAAVSLVIIAILTLVWKIYYPYILSTFGENVANKYSYDILAYEWKNIWNVILCKDISQAPILWHTWFVVPYFILSCLFWFQEKAASVTGRGGYLIICIVIFFIAWAIIPQIKLIALYNVFYISGYLFYQKIHKKFIILAASVFLMLMFYFYVDKSIIICPMQFHKVQGDYVFLVYGLLSLSLLSLLLGSIKLKANWVLNLWNERGYTIYLYQNWIYFLFFPVFLKYIAGWNSSLLQIAACGFCVFIMSTLLSYITYRFEKLVIGKI